MHSAIYTTVLTASLILTGCSFTSYSEPVLDGASSSSIESEDLITHNVSYTGIIEEIGASIYQQGTHKLLLEDGQFVLLESTDSNLNLNTYLRKNVEIHGSLQPTVEAGGMLLRVEEIIVLDISSSSSTSETATEGEKKMCGGIAGIDCDNSQECVDDTSDSCDPMNGGADCAGICVHSAMESSLSSSSSKSLVFSSTSSTASVSNTSTSSSSSKSTSSLVISSVSSAQSSTKSISSAIEQQNIVLSKQAYDQENLWTQKYCTSHIAFCVPVHKNWYFKSFGATTNNVWHVELGMVDIGALGDGAIILNLVSGTSASMQAQDGQIKVQGTDIIGFKDWDNGTHFEIIADARLKAAVSYMLTHITPYAGAQ